MGRRGGGGGGGEDGGEERGEGGAKGAPWLNGRLDLTGACGDAAQYQVLGCQRRTASDTTAQAYTEGAPSARTTARYIRWAHSGSFFCRHRDRAAQQHRRQQLTDNVSANAFKRGSNPAASATFLLFVAVPLLSPQSPLAIYIPLLHPSQCSIARSIYNLSTGMGRADGSDATRRRKMCRSSKKCIVRSARVVATQVALLIGPLLYRQGRGGEK